MGVSQGLMQRAVSVGVAVDVMCTENNHLPEIRPRSWCLPPRRDRIWGCWKTRNAQEQNGMEPEVMMHNKDVDAGQRGQKLALIRTVFASLRTLIYVL